MLILFINIFSLIISFVFIILIKPLWCFHPLIYIGGLILGTLLFLFISYIASLLFVPDKNNVRKPKKFFINVTYLCAKLVITVCNVRIKAIGFDKIESKNCLFVSNHQSMMDPITIIASNKNIGLAFVMRQNVEFIPMVGRCLVCGGFLTINRNNNREGLETINKAIDRLKNGYPIGVFPEGTRSKGPNMGPFHDGSFKIALRSQSDICVVVVDNEYDIHNNAPLRKTKVYSKMCGVLKYDDIKDLHTKEISQIVKKMMEEGLQDLRENYEK